MKAAQAIRRVIEYMIDMCVVRRTDFHGNCKGTWAGKPVLGKFCFVFLFHLALVIAPNGMINDEDFFSFSYDLLLNCPRIRGM